MLVEPPVEGIENVFMFPVFEPKRMDLAECSMVCPRSDIRCWGVDRPPGKNGADGGARTRKPIRATDFKSLKNFPSPSRA